MKPKVTADLHSGLKPLLELNLTSPAAISVFPFIHRFKHRLLDRLSYLISCLGFYSKTDMPKTKKTNKELGVNEVCLSWYNTKQEVSLFKSIPGFHRSQNENMITLKFQVFISHSKLSAKAKRRIFFFFNLMGPFFGTLPISLKEIFTWNIINRLKMKRLQQGHEEK